MNLEDKIRNAILNDGGVIKGAVDEILVLAKIFAIEKTTENLRRFAEELKVKTKIQSCNNGKGCDIPYCDIPCYEINPKSIDESLNYYLKENELE